MFYPKRLDTVPFAAQPDLMAYPFQMEYYSTIKMNEIMAFAAIWMQLETLILSEVRKRKTNAI